MFGVSPASALCGYGGRGVSWAAEVPGGWVCAPGPEVHVAPVRGSRENADPGVLDAEPAAGGSEEGRRDSAVKTLPPARGRGW